MPFAIGTIHIHAALKEMTNDKWDNMTLSWQSVALPACASKASGMEDFSLASMGGTLRYTKQHYYHHLVPLLLKKEVQ